MVAAAPSVVALVTVVVLALVFARLILAAPAPVVAAVMVVAPELTSCVLLPRPLAAVRSSVAALRCGPAPLPCMSPAEVAVIVSPNALTLAAMIFPDPVVVRITLRPAPPALTLVAVRFPPALLNVMAPSVVVTEVAVTAPPPLCATVMPAPVPTVLTLASVVVAALVFATLIEAAPPPLVAAVRLVTPDVSSCVLLPIPVTAFNVSGPAVTCGPPPLP